MISSHVPLLVDGSQTQTHKKMKEVRKYRTCKHLAQSAAMGHQQTKEDH
jgi:hypothetical protein